MSSTNRGTIRNINDFYSTPRGAIESLLKVHQIKYPVLEPCSGYDAIVNLLNHNEIIYTNDVDIQMPSQYHINFCNGWNDDWNNVKTIITNPPYIYALDIIQNSLSHIADGSNVIMLLRLNFLSSIKRKDFWKNNPAKSIYVLSERPSFTKKGTDSIEYAWFVWEKSFSGKMNLEVV